MLYAVGDIHGQLDKLENALSLIKDDGGPNDNNGYPFQPVNEEKK